ncbi:uncharacterized protein Hap1MRO34_013602 [Clarias gariepinus]
MEDRTVTLSSKISELEKEIQHFKEDVQLLKNERKTTNKKHEKKIKRLRKQVKTLCFEMWSLQVEQDRQGEETTELTCHNRALEQRLENNRCFLQLKDDLISQIKHKVEKRKEKEAEKVKRQKRNKIAVVLCFSLLVVLGWLNCILNADVLLSIS